MRVRKNVLLTGMITLAAVSILLAGCTDMRDAKPVIYLYPEQTQEVSVQLELDGKLTCAYPEYGSGWRVKAYPDGTLLDQDTGKKAPAGSVRPGCTCNTPQARIPGEIDKKNDAASASDTLQNPAQRKAPHENTGCSGAETS